MLARMSSSEAIARSRSRDEPAHVGFLLVPDFAMLPYASVIEPLRAANRLSGRSLYRWSQVSPDGEPVAASNGVKIQADFQVGTDEPFDYVFICAGGNPALFRDQATLGWLRRLASRKVALGGVSGGPYILARAGLLDGFRFTIHWEHAPALAEDYPGLDLRRSLYEIDRGRLTSAGGSAPLDMMHALIAQEHGQELALAVSEWFLQTHVREGSGPQRMPLRERLGIASVPLLRVVARMEQTTENPVEREELARIAHVSLRQLERLFRRHLGRSLGEHYLRLRLERARELLQQTSMPVLETALACGFTSASHFSRAYGARYGHPPRDERKQRGSSDRDSGAEAPPPAGHSDDQPIRSEA